jgi:anti-sigma28 factor (negative regulator of flagellin synthesis)
MNSWSSPLQTQNLAPTPKKRKRTNEKHSSGSDTKEDEDEMTFVKRIKQQEETDRNGASAFAEQLVNAIKEVVMLEEQAKDVHLHRPPLSKPLENVAMKFANTTKEDFLHYGQLNLKDILKRLQGYLNDYNEVCNKRNAYNPEVVDDFFSN